MFAQLLGMYLILSFIVAIYISLWFLLGIFKKRVDVIDIAWGLGFILIALITFFLVPDFSYKSFLATLLVIFWGYRLASHISQRLKNSSEDFRYKKYREIWKDNFYLKLYVNMYLLQGLIMLIVALPVVLINLNGGAISFFTILGSMVWCFGFFIESVADTQLREFISDKKHKNEIMQYGLWKYSRHPNYFGEILQWVGLAVIAADVPLGYLAFISPALISFLLIKVSGIPPLEKRFEGNHAYDSYKKRTSMLIPLPVKETK